MPKNDHTDSDDRAVERLVKELQAGHRWEENYEQLFRRYYPVLMAFFRKRGVSADRSKDLIQDTFLNAFQGIARFQHGARFDTWLYAVAGNVWKNSLRSRSTQKRDAPEVQLEPELVSAAGRNPEQKALAGESQRLKRRAFREALEELPPQMRRCMMMRIDQELKYREIAEVLGIEINTVKSLLHEAKKRLQRKLGEFPELGS